MRIVIMGLQPLEDGLPALEHGRTGARLEAWLGGKPSKWFSLMNVLPAGVDPRSEVAHRTGNYMRYHLEQRDCPDALIVLGHDAARLLGLEHGPGVPFYRWLCTPPGEIPLRWALMPHPSPKSGHWHRADSFTIASRFLGRLRDQVAGA